MIYDGNTMSLFEQQTVYTENMEIIIHFRMMQSYEVLQSENMS